MVWSGVERERGPGVEKEKREEEQMIEVRSGGKLSKFGREEGGHRGESERQERVKEGRGEENMEEGREERMGGQIV